MAATLILIAKLKLYQLASSSCLTQRCESLHAFCPLPKRPLDRAPLASLGWVLWAVKWKASNLLVKTLAATPRTKNDPFAFVIHDAHEPSVSKFLESHSISNAQLIHATSPSSVVKLSSTIITMLPSSPQVEQVYLDSEVGILSTLKDMSPEQCNETLCVDCTTLEQGVAKQVAQQIINTGSLMLDAPVSGGVVGAREGTLSFMCGGPESAFKKAQPLFDVMGKRSIYCGPSGNGLAAKIANNLLLGISMIGTAEAMILGEQLGLSPQLLASILNTSTGKCWSSDINNPSPHALSGTGKSPPADRDWQGGFLSKLMSKDLSLATTACQQSNLALPLANVANRIYEKLASHEDFSNRDFSVVYDWLQRGNAGLQERKVQQDTKA